MCGIAAIIGNNPLRQQHMDSMLQIMQHRGPDASQTCDLGTQGILGHNRLSIIDLQEAANQPFHSYCGRYTIVFNGEIYNYLELKAQLKSIYPFRTQSDTEVLLAAYLHWGADCLKELIGMFAFAVWDRQAQTLFAARDRFGVKPLYYTIQNHALWLASEIKAFWAAGVLKTPNEKVWAGYLTHGSYGQPNETFWLNIQQLPGGHWLKWENATLQIVQWYDFVSRVQQTEVLPTTEGIRQRWLELAINSIQLRFRADVPVGFNVSGGLDSSLLLSLVYHLYPTQSSINAFTFYTGDKRYDELPWVESMIGSTNFPLQRVQLNAEEVPALAAKVAWHQDEPYGGIPTLAYAKIFAAARQQGTIVLLDGQGMDEAWAGYDYYWNQQDTLVQGVSSSPVRPDCLNPEFRALANKIVYPTPFDNRLQNLQYRDLFYTKIPRALRFNDRVSMMYSTELREPFLDHRLVEFAFALNEKYKIQNGQTKWLARTIAAAHLPGKIHLAPKRPLQTPQREWLAEDLKPWVNAELEAMLDDATTANWFVPEAVLQNLQRFQQGNNDNSFFVWQWLDTQLLHNQSTASLTRSY